MNNLGYMKIGEIASLFNVSVKAIRVYEKKGIIAPAMLDPSTGYRLYEREQMLQLGTLLKLRSLGFSLSEIKEILSSKDKNEFLKSELLRKRIMWQDAILSGKEKAKAVGRIRSKIKQYEAKTGFSQLTNEERAWLLIKLICNDSFKGNKELSEALWL